MYMNVVSVCDTRNMHVYLRIDAALASDHKQPK